MIWRGRLEVSLRLRPGSQGATSKLKLNHEVVGIENENTDGIIVVS